MQDYSPNSLIDFIMETTEAAVYRLTNQHEAITGSTGKLVFAPVDFTKPGLRILDSATADGSVYSLYYHLYTLANPVKREMACRPEVFPPTGS